MEVVLTLVVGFVGVWFVVFWSYYRHIKRVPSPRLWPIIGNAMEFTTTSEVLTVLDSLYKKLNTKTLRIHIGFRTLVQTKDYKFLEFLLSSQSIISKGIGYSFLHEWLGLGLLTSDGQKWRTHRKMITPTFHFKILEEFIDVFNSKGKIMIEKLQKEVGNKSFDVFPYVTLCALDIICETAMGTCVNAQNEESSLYAKCVKDMGRIIQQRGLNPIYHYKVIYQFTKLCQEEKAALKVLHGYTNSVISKRRAQLEAVAKSTQKTEDDIGQKKRTAFLDMLLQATINGVPLTDKEIREEVDTFMFEGHDTTAAGICYTLFNLANHPEVQQRAFEELKDIFGDDTERECSYQDLQEMKYLEMVVKETLRLYPSVPLYARMIKDDVTYNGMVLPKGMTIGIYAYGIQRDPDYFPNPEKFDPERFAPENYDGRQPYAYIPFSAGPRNCIGQKFAILEMKASVSKVLRHYKLKPATPTHHLQLAAESILKAVNGVKIAIEKQTY